MQTPTRDVICGDAIAYLHANSLGPEVAVITSLPDVSELRGQSLDDWKSWFANTAALILEKCDPDSVAIFYQTDVFRNSAWIDKGHLIHVGADRVKAHMLWHKIVCRVSPGDTCEGRPGYAHMLCFSRGRGLGRGATTSDVIPDIGSMDWSRAMGRKACVAAAEWLRANTNAQTVLDPFCGTGTVLAVANELNLNAIGLEIDATRAQRAARKR